MEGRVISSVSSATPAPHSGLQDRTQRPQSLSLNVDRRTSIQSVSGVGEDGDSASRVTFDVKPPKGAAPKSQALNPRIAELRRIHANVIHVTDDFGKDEDDDDSSESGSDGDDYVPLSLAHGASDSA